MTKLPRRLGGESPEQSVIRKVRSSGPGMSLWLRELCSHPVTWAGSGQARLNTSALSRLRWPECSPHVDRCRLSSPDSSNHHAARNHVWQAWQGVPQPTLCVPAPCADAVRGSRGRSYLRHRAPLAGILDATRRDAGMTKQLWPSWWVVTRVQPGDYPGKQSAQLNKLLRASARALTFRARRVA